MAPTLQSSQPNRLVPWVTRQWGWILIAAILLIVAPFLTPGAIYFWSYRGFKSLFRDDLGFGSNLAVVLALAGAFFYAIAVPYALRWLIIGRRRLLSFVAVMIVFGTTPLLHVLLDSNFNQVTGEAQKWYAWHPGGEVILSDSGGFDPVTGAEKRRLTPEVAEILARQRKGLRQKQIVDDPDQLAFFDRVTGQPQIWYSSRSDGTLSLFDSEGFDPESGALLRPISNKIIAELHSRAAEATAQAKAAAKARTQEEAATAKTKAHNDLMNLFNAGAYTPGIVIFGARARQTDDSVSMQAAQVVVRQAVMVLRASGITATELATGVYSSRYYDMLMQGDGAALSETGLASKMRAALLVLLDCTCRQATSVGDLISCKIFASVRTFASGGTLQPSDEWSETGVGTSQDAAIVRASQLLFERHQMMLARQ